MPEDSVRYRPHRPVEYRRSKRGVNIPADLSVGEEEKEAIVQEIIDLYARSKPDLGGGIPEIQQKRDQEAANIQYFEGKPSVMDVPVLGPVLRGLGDYTPFGWLGRALGTEEFDVFMGKRPSGAPPGSYSENRLTESVPIDSRDMAITGILGQGIDSQKERQALQSITRIDDLENANRVFTVMQAGIRSPDNPGGYTPEQISEVADWKRKAEDPINVDPNAASMYIRTIGRIRAERELAKAQRLEYTQLQKDKLTLEGKAVANQAARYNNKWAGWDRVRRDKVDPVTGMQEIDKNGQPLLQDVMVKINKRTGEIKEVVLPGQITDRLALRPTPEAASQARLRESVTQRLFTEEQQLATFGSAVMAAGQSLSPWLTALKDGSALKIGSRGTLGNVIRTLSGVTDQLRKVRVMEANPGFTLEQVNAEAGRIGESLKNIRLYDTETGKWLLPGGDQLVRISDIPKKFQAMGENDKKQSLAMIFLRNQGMSGIADRAQRYSNIASKQAYYAGQEYQAAIVLAQLRSRGRMSRGATSQTLPTTAITQMLKRFGQLSSTTDLERFVSGVLGSTMRDAQARMDNWMRTEEFVPTRLQNLYDLNPAVWMRFNENWERPIPGPTSFEQPVPVIVGDIPIKDGMELVGPLEEIRTPFILQDGTGNPVAIPGLYTTQAGDDTSGFDKEREK